MNQPDPQSIPGEAGKPCRRPEEDYRFGLDLSRVGALPEDARLRNGYFTAFRELIRAEKEKIRAWHRSGAGGREVVAVQTGLVDEIIRQVIGALTGLPAYAGQKVESEFALIAVGGYGRGELNPHSDIDLLFLLRDKHRPLANTFIQDAISVFWGIGLEIGQSCRTIKDCLKLAEQDLTVKTAMIETRHLAGDAALAREFLESVAGNIHMKKVGEFMNSSLKEKYDRFGPRGVVSQPEPDIKNGPGGLRDYHVALWAVAVRFGRLSFREIGRDEVVSREEMDVLDGALDFAFRVRNELHFLARKKHDVLNLDLQQELAANLGYEPSGGMQPVERFMRDYFINATHIHNYCAQIFNHCLKQQPSIRKTIASLVRKKEFGDGFYTEDAKLALAGAAAVLAGQPRLILEAFRLTARHGFDLDPDLRREIRRHHHLLDEAFVERHDACAGFLAEVLKQPRSENTLRLMHDVGVLGRILPEFGRTFCGVHYDFYHRYTTDEHSLRMIRFLEELEDGKTAADETELAALYRALPDKSLLKIASLVHTLDADGGAVTGVAARFRLDAENSRNLAFLVGHLYEMMDTAFHEDIHQPAVIEEFAKTVETKERLQLLHLVSYAELKAVAADTWSAWKKNLLDEIGSRTRAFLDRPESLVEQPGQTRIELSEILCGEVAAEEIENHLQQMPEDYLVTAYAAEIALHLRLIRSLAGRAFALDRSFNESGGFHNIVVCSAAGSSAFRKTVGTLTSRNLNILGAQVYLRRDGIIIVTTQVEGMGHMDLQDPRLWEEVETSLRDVLEDRGKLSGLFRGRTRYVLENKKSAMAITPKVQLENTEASPYTVLRVEARDHPGMLYKIAKALSDLCIQVHRAKIACKGGRGVDVFYVSDGGKKILLEPFKLKIKENLVNALLVERLEDIGD